MSVTSWGASDIKHIGFYGQAVLFDSILTPASLNKLVPDSVFQEPSDKADIELSNS